MRTNAENGINSEAGRATVEALIELLVLVMVVPPIICCALQVALSLVGMVLPWLALVTITVTLGACLAAAVAAGRYLPPPRQGPIPPPALPPIRRPRGIPDRHGGFDPGAH